MKSSWLAAAKSAGMKHFVTCLIGVRCSISKLARLCIDFRIRANADETRKPGTFVCDLPIRWLVLWAMRMDYLGSCLQYLDLYRHAIALSQNPWIYPRVQQLILCDELSNSWLHSLHRHVRTILEICILHLIDHSLENRSKTEWCLRAEGITRTLKPRVYTNYYHACKQRRASPPTSVHFQEAQSDCIQYFVLSYLLT